MPGIAHFSTPAHNRDFYPDMDPGLGLFTTAVRRHVTRFLPTQAMSRSMDMFLADRMSSPSDLLSPEEANERYGIKNQLQFDEPINKDRAALMWRSKQAELELEHVISLGTNSTGRKLWAMGIGLGAQVLDPINVASMFIPVTGLATGNALFRGTTTARVLRASDRHMRLVSNLSGFGTTRIRATRGLIEASIGQALIEPLILIPALQEQANYGLKDSVLNIGFGALVGTGLHVGLGRLGDAISLKAKTRKTHQQLSLLKERFDNLTEDEHGALIEAGLADALQDRPITSPGKLISLSEAELLAEAVSSRGDSLSMTARLSDTTPGPEGWVVVDRSEGMITWAPKEEVRRMISGQHPAIRNPASRADLIQAINKSGITPEDVGTLPGRNGRKGITPEDWLEHPRVKKVLMDEGFDGYIGDPKARNALDVEIRAFDNARFGKPNEVKAMLRESKVNDLKREAKRERINRQEEIRQARQTPVEKEIPKTAHAKNNLEEDILTIDEDAKSLAETFGAKVGEEGELKLDTETFGDLTKEELDFVIRELEATGDPVSREAGIRKIAQCMLRRGGS